MFRCFWKADNIDGAREQVTNQPASRAFVTLQLLKPNGSVGKQTFISGRTLIHLCRVRV